MIEFTVGLALIMIALGIATAVMFLSIMFGDHDDE